MNAVIAFLSVAIFVAGLWCYGLAFQMPSDMLSILVFTGGVLLNCLAFFIPWQILGHGRK